MPAEAASSVVTTRHGIRHSCDLLVLVALLLTHYRLSVLAGK
jgi:hypothetical protein